MADAAVPPGWPRPRRPRLAGWLGYRLQRLLAPRPAYRRLARLLDKPGPARNLFTGAERVTKSALFGCRMCGRCALPLTGYACPMTCPKELRNGPCGGVGADGSCEVYPDRPCVWVIAVERADQAGHRADLTRLHRPADHREWGRSSWVSYWLGRDDDATAAPVPAALLATTWPAAAPGPVLLPMPTLRTAGRSRSPV